ncbi:hypothetical protein B0H15DRAFT_785644 [Mycena belliarum]|uniref:Uncharacterized protein n=1 Tax=Mycena belliarum TaxID=1033014 RepID=A0AAD6TZ66_9AGAR|nr:hypothetical protein B0H15DRAFT_785644 [Mycena belliae]
MLPQAASFLFALFFLALFAPANANYKLPKLEIFSAVSFPRLDLRPQASGFSFDLEVALPPATSALEPLATVPIACSVYAGPGGECAAGMVATAVTYEDCGNTFDVCRCTDANMTMDTVVDRLGRVPVGLRRFLGTVLVLGGKTQAYTNLSTGDVHFFGQCAMETWIHEAAHALDYAIETAPLSNSVGWEKATLRDSCVPDNYSLTNQVEDFAQMAVIKTYMLLHSGNLPPGFEAACMENQLAFLNALPVFNPLTLFGNTCAISAVPDAR